MADFYPESSRPYPRVTQILQATDSPEDKERLRKWQHKMNSLSIQKGTPNADIISHDAREKGTIFHDAIHAYFLNGKEPFFDPQKDCTMYGSEQWNQ